MQNYRLIMDLQCFAQEKTEKATPKKKLDSRKKGQVAKSAEIPSSFILFFTFIFLLLFGGYFKDRMMQMFTVSFYEYMLWDISFSTVNVIFTQLIYHGFLLLLPIFIISVVLAMLGNLVQVGVLFATDPLKPKFKKINPLEGAKRIFSTRAIVEFSKSLFKMIVIGVISYLTIYNQQMNILSLSGLPLDKVMSYTGTITVILGLQIGFVLMFIAILDYIYQKYDFEKKQRMSKQEVKDEYKKSEGDPLIKGKIREKQRQMAMQRMMQEIPNADVVVTNPTHFAVALKYNADEMEAPAVIAKGQDYTALKIKETAKQHDIITMENKPLARALYYQVEIGESIPDDLFQAVAEVLAYVYKVKQKA